MFCVLFLRIHEYSSTFKLFTVHCSVTDCCFRLIVLCFPSSCSESEMSKYHTTSHVLSVTLWEGRRLWNANLLPRRMFPRLQEPRSEMVLITTRKSSSGKPRGVTSPGGWYPGPDLPGGILSSPGVLQSQPGVSLSWLGEGTQVLSWQCVPLSWLGGTPVLTWPRGTPSWDPPPC